MQLDEVYRASRLRLVALAAELTPEQAATRVPACPEWTVADVYRHVTGIPTDVLDGNLENRGTPAWTAAQVARRADQSPLEVCAEWSARAPEFEKLLATSGMTNARAAIDVNAHEKDVLAALGRRGDRDDPALSTLAEVVLGMLAAADDLPVTTRIDLGAQAATVGSGEPEVTLRTTPYEFLRMVLGRRSAAQLAAADWSGPDPARVAGALSRFPLPTADIVD